MGLKGFRGSGLRIQGFRVSVVFSLLFLRRGAGAVRFSSVVFEGKSLRSSTAQGLMSSGGFRVCDFNVHGLRVLEFERFVSFAAVRFYVY